MSIKNLFKAIFVFAVFFAITAFNQPIAQGQIADYSVGNIVVEGLQNCLSVTQAQRTLVSWGAGNSASNFRVTVKCAGTAAGLLTDSGAAPYFSAAKAAFVSFPNASAGNWCKVWVYSNWNYIPGVSGSFRNVANTSAFQICASIGVPPAPVPQTFSYCNPGKTTCSNAFQTATAFADFVKNNQIAKWFSGYGCLDPLTGKFACGTGQEDIPYYSCEYNSGIKKWTNYNLCVAGKGDWRDCLKYDIAYGSEGCRRWSACSAEGKCAQGGFQTLEGCKNSHNGASCYIDTNCWGQCVTIGQGQTQDFYECNAYQGWIGPKQYADYKTCVAQNSNNQKKCLSLSQKDSCKQWEYCIDGQCIKSSSAGYQTQSDCIWNYNECYNAGTNCAGKCGTTGGAKYSFCNANDKCEQIITPCTGTKCFQNADCGGKGDSACATTGGTEQKTKFYHCASQTGYDITGEYYNSYECLNASNWNLNQCLTEAQAQVKCEQGEEEEPIKTAFYYCDFYGACQATGQFASQTECQSKNSASRCLLNCESCAKKTYAQCVSGKCNSVSSCAGKTNCWETDECNQNCKAESLYYCDRSYSLPFCRPCAANTANCVSQTSCETSCKAANPSLYYCPRTGTKCVKTTQFLDYQQCTDRNVLKKADTICYDEFDQTSCDSACGEEPPKEEEYYSKCSGAICQKIKGTCPGGTGVFCDEDCGGRGNTACEPEYYSKCSTSGICQAIKGACPTGVKGVFCNTKDCFGMGNKACDSNKQTFSYCDGNACVNATIEECEGRVCMEGTCGQNNNAAICKTGGEVIQPEKTYYSCAAENSCKATDISQCRGLSASGAKNCFEDDGTCGGKNCRPTFWYCEKEEGCRAVDDYVNMEFCKYGVIGKTLQGVSSCFASEGTCAKDCVASFENCQTVDYILEPDVIQPGCKEALVKLTLIPQRNDSSPGYGNCKNVKASLNLDGAGGIIFSQNIIGTSKFAFVLRQSLSWTFPTLTKPETVTFKVKGINKSLNTQAITSENGLITFDKGSTVIGQIKVNPQKQCAGLVDEKSKTGEELTGCQTKKYNIPITCSQTLSAGKSTCDNLMVDLKLPVGAKLQAGFSPGWTQIGAGQYRAQLGVMNDNETKKLPVSLVYSKGSNKTATTLYTYIVRNQTQSFYQAQVPGVIESCCGNGELDTEKGETCQTCPQEPDCLQECVCPMLYDPVCGKNGETYSNSCAAACDKMEVDYKGACKKEEPAISVYKEAIPSEDCDYAEITLALVCKARVVPTIGAPPPKQANIDLVFNIDKSGSSVKDAETGRPMQTLEQEKAEAIKLIDKLNPATDRVAVLAYDQDVERVAPQLTNDFESIKAKIRGITADPDGGTDIAEALSESRKIMESQGRNEAEKHIVLLSDGISSYAFDEKCWTGLKDSWPTADTNCTKVARSEAAKIKSSPTGITLHTVGVNLNEIGKDHPQSVSYIRGVLKDMATSPANYHESADGVDLAKKLGNIADEYGARDDEENISADCQNVKVSDILPAGVDYISVLDGTAKPTQQGKNLKWDLGTIDGVNYLRFKVKVAKGVEQNPIDVYPASGVTFGKDKKFLEFPKTYVDMGGCGEEGKQDIKAEDCYRGAKIYQNNTCLGKPFYVKDILLDKSQIGFASLDELKKYIDSVLGVNIASLKSKNPSAALSIFNYDSVKNIFKQCPWKISGNTQNTIGQKCYISFGVNSCPGYLVTNADIEDSPPRLFDSQKACDEYIEALKNASFGAMDLQYTNSTSRELRPALWLDENTKGYLGDPTCGGRK